MIPTSAAVSGALTFARVGCGSDLKLNGHFKASLRKTGFWSATFEAKTTEGNWLFRPANFLGNLIEIVDVASGNSVATFKGGWSNCGTLVFADGQTFRISSKGFWRPVWSATNSDGQPVVEVHVREKTVETFNTPAISESQIVLMILMTLHRMRQAEESAAVAV